MLEVGANVVAFNDVWIEVSKLSGGFIDNNFVPWTAKEVQFKSNLLKSQA